MFLAKLFRRCHFSCPALILAFGVFFSATVFAQGSQSQPSRQVVVDSIAAIVNSDVITKGELNERVTLLEAQLRKQNVALPPREEFQKQVLEHMIVERAQLQLAKDMGLRVDDTQLDRTIALMAEQNHMSLAQFKQHTEQNGTPFEKFREKIREEIIMSRLRDREVVNKIQINDAEVDNLLGTESQLQMPEQVRLGHILVRIPENASPEQIAEKKARAEKVLDILKSGGDFQQSAASYSDADEGLSGGDIGWRNTDRLPKSFVDALAGVKPGNVTGIIKSPNGFHILKVLDRRKMTTGPESPTTASNVNTVQQIHARHILIKVNQLVSADEAKRKLIDLKQRLLNKSATFDELAKTYSNDGSASRGGDLGWIYPGDTVPEFEKAMMALKPGEISEPIETQFGFHLIEVLDKKTDDVSAERKRIAAKQALRERKVAEATEEWLRQLRDKAYVEYRLDEKPQ